MFMNPIKNRRIIKKALCLFFAFLLSINSFAAVVSDNDGSAFITKAEFDSLKNNFQNQLDSYNSGIDSKIDSAIAGYLAGIKVEKVEELESILNKVNEKCEDFYIDSGGNKVKYNFRAMSRMFNIPTTQVPKGAITNFFISRSDIPDNEQHGWARFGLTYGTRTSFNDVIVPETGYQTGKYFLVDETSDGSLFSINEVNEMTYRFYTGGSSFTHGVYNQASSTTSNNGTLSTAEDFKNNNNFWSMKVGQVTYTYHHQNNIHDYDSWRCAYGTSFNNSKSYMTMPVCGVTDNSIIALRKSNLVKMTLQDTVYTWNLYYTIRSVYAWNNTTNGRYDHSNEADGDPTGKWSSPNAMPSLATFPWKFYFNCHPYETINTKSLIDDTATTLLGKEVKITDGIPVFKVPRDGIVDMKVKFVKPTTSTITTCGATFRNEPFKNTYYGYNYSANLNCRDFDNVKYATNMWDIDKEYNVRMDVKKGDVIYVKAVDITDEFGVVGVKTTQIKLTEKE